jgi:hypothetical protein
MADSDKGVDSIISNDFKSLCDAEQNLRSQKCKSIYGATYSVGKGDDTLYVHTVRSDCGPMDASKASTAGCVDVWDITKSHLYADIVHEYCKRNTVDMNCDEYYDKLQRQSPQASGKSSLKGSKDIISPILSVVERYGEEQCIAWAFAMILTIAVLRLCWSIFWRSSVRQTYKDWTSKYTVVSDISEAQKINA